MATFTELQTAFADGEMINLVKAAILKKAASIIEESTPSAERLQFAQDSLKDPEKWAGSLWRFIVGKNSTATLENILRSNGSDSLPADATIESQVNTAINALWA